jgi:hypothetical protein
VELFRSEWGKAGAEKRAKQKAPVAIWRGGYLPYFSKWGLFWAFFSEREKISILRGFPDTGKGNGARFEIILVQVSAWINRKHIRISRFQRTINTRTVKDIS